MKKLISIIAVLGTLAFASAASAQSITDGNFYGGASVATDVDQGSAFVGYENQDGKFYYAAEAGYIFAEQDGINLTARAGLEMFPRTVVYALAGHGWQTNGSDASGVNYGFGAKYKATENLSVGAELVHQEYQNFSTDNVSIRGIFKF